MSVIPRGFGSVDPTSFHPLFRFIDDFENYSQTSLTGKDQHHGYSLRTFNPKFDVKETAHNYELHGELPGIDQKDIEIDFTDAQTLVIHGRIERSYTKSTASDGKKSEESKSGSNITAEGESGHQVTMSDEDDEKRHGNNSVSTTEATHTREEPQYQSQAKYWVRERSVGEFSRSFNFPSNVDSDAVTASMTNGILSIVVPKAKKAGGRKIKISS